MSEWRDLAISDAINRMAQSTEKYKDWSAKLIHFSGFVNYLDPAIQNIIGPADVITVQRNLISEEVFDAIRYWQGMGKVFVADIDDAYPILPWSNPAHEFWINDPNNIQPVSKLEEGLALCGYLTSPNRLILYDWQHVTKGFHIQNYARREWWTNLEPRINEKRKRNLQDRIVIGWGGSVSHYDSFWGSGIFEASKHIVKHHPNVVFMICGNDPRIYEQLPVHKDNKYFQHGVENKDWPQVVKTFDIGIAPLYGPYDQRRSWIKTLEYGLAGVPWVATSGEPYSDHAELGRNIENSPANWEKAIESIISNLGREQSIAENRIKHYQKWFIDNQLDKYGDTFSRIISENKQKITRLPGISYVNWK